MDELDDPADLAVRGDLRVAGVVADEGDPGGEQGERYGEEERPPGGADQGEPGHDGGDA